MGAMPLKSAHERVQSIEVIPGYDVLLNDCKNLYENAYKRAMKGILEFYWELGKKVSQALNGRKARYGEDTILKLSNDLQISRTNLYDAITLSNKFSRTELTNALSWSHYRALLPLKIEEAHLLANDAVEKGMSVKALRNAVKKKRKKRNPSKLSSACCKLQNLLESICDKSIIEMLKQQDYVAISQELKIELISKIELAESTLEEIKSLVKYPNIPDVWNIGNKPY